MGETVKKKILIVCCNNLDRGGIQSVIMNSVRALHHLYTFDIITFDNNETYYDKEFESYGGTIFRCGALNGKRSFHKKLDFYIRGPYLYASAKKVIKNSGPYAAIHCHNMYESACFLAAAKKYGVPVRIVHAHTAFKNNYGNFVACLYKKLLKKYMYKYGNVFAGCSTTANKISYQDKKAIVLPNMLNSELYEHGDFKNIDTDSPKLLQIGLYCDNKNQLFTLDVFKYIAQEYPGAKLTYVGRAPTSDLEAYFNKLKQAAQELPKGSVEFLEADTDLAAAYNNAHYLIFPSLAEGFGIVAVEAQSMGLRCFVSDAVPQDVNCGGCNFLPLKLGAKEWAQKITEDFALTKGNKEKYDCRRFSQNAVANKYIDLYEGRLM